MVNHHWSMRPRSHNLSNSKLSNPLQQYICKVFKLHKTCVFWTIMYTDSFNINRAREKVDLKVALDYGEEEHR